eukprot:scaffold302823_cov17-Tisochrysis_lutea.AAC.1
MQTCHPVEQLLPWYTCAAAGGDIQGPNHTVLQPWKAAFCRPGVQAGSRHGALSSLRLALFHSICHWRQKGSHNYKVAPET